jgi:hypothetical protein
MFRHVFEAIVERRMTEVLVRGEGFAVDGSIMKADANRRRGVHLSPQAGFERAMPIARPLTIKAPISDAPAAASAP